MTIKSTTYAKFGKNSKNDQNWTPRATGLSEYEKCTINRCLIQLSTFLYAFYQSKKYHLRKIFNLSKKLNF